MGQDGLVARLRAAAGRIYDVTVSDVDLLVYEAKRAGAKPLAVRQGADLLDTVSEYLVDAANQIEGAS
jgi:hypothetical protein